MSGIVSCGAVLSAIWYLNRVYLPAGIVEQRGLPEGTNISQGLAIPVLIALGVAVVMTFIATRRRFGRYVYGIGGNPEAAELAGIKTKRTIVKTFAVMGLLVGLAAAVRRIGDELVADALVAPLRREVVQRHALGCPVPADQHPFEVRAVPQSAVVEHVAERFDDRERVERLELVQVSSDRVLLVMTLKSGVVRTIFVEVPSLMAPDVVVQVTVVLNEPSGAAGTGCPLISSASVAPVPVTVITGPSDASRKAARSGDVTTSSPGWCSSMGPFFGGRSSSSLSSVPQADVSRSAARKRRAPIAMPGNCAWLARTQSWSSTWCVL